MEDFFLFRSVILIFNVLNIFCYFVLTNLLAITFYKLSDYQILNCSAVNMSNKEQGKQLRYNLTSHKIHI